MAVEPVPAARPRIFRSGIARSDPRARALQLYISTVVVGERCDRAPPLQHAAGWPTAGCATWRAEDRRLIVYRSDRPSHAGYARLLGRSIGGVRWHWHEP